MLVSASTDFQGRDHELPRTPSARGSFMLIEMRLEPLPCIPTQQSNVALAWHIDL